MKIRDLMTSPVHTCRPHDSLEDAARQLWEHDCGMLPVVDHEGRVGAAITDRDICMGAYTRGGRLADLRVADSMSRDIVTCKPDDDVATAVERMAARQLHRLPVVDADGKPCGVLSLNDIALAGEHDQRLARAALKTLTNACHRRTPSQAAARKHAGRAHRRASAAAAQSVSHG